MTPDRILQLGLGFWASKTLLSAVELGVFTELAERAARRRGAARPAGAAPRAARATSSTRWWRSACWSARTASTANTPATDLFLDRRKPTLHRRHAGDGQRPPLSASGATLTEGLRTGQPQNEAKTGGDFFEALYADPERLRGVPARHDRPEPRGQHGDRRRVPVGRLQDLRRRRHAPQGDLAVQVALAHPHLTGGGFDLPRVGPVFEEYVAGARPRADRLRVHRRRLLRRPAAAAPTCSMMGHILHDWDLDAEAALLAKAYEALPGGRRADRLRGDHRRRPPQERLRPADEPEHADRDPGGFDYTGADCRGWMREAGFRETRVEHLVGPDSMVVGIK